MKPNRNKLICVLFVLMVISMTIRLSLAQQDERKDTGHQKNPLAVSQNEAERFVSIDFNDVDIHVVIQFISELTKENFIVDPKVKGKVTIISPTKISIKEAYKVFESVLEVHGFTTVKAGEVTKILPAPDARSKNIDTFLQKEKASPEDKIVTQLIPLKYADPNEIKRLFSPLISKDSVLLAYPPTNMLILTDVYSNITRLIQIIAVIDIPGIGSELSYIPLEFADATKLVTLLNSVFKKTRKPVKGQVDEAIEFMADDRTNAIILLASKDDTQRVKELLALLDKQAPKGKEKIRVYYLENATADELSEVLLTLSSKNKGVDKGKKIPMISDNVTIAADKATNSLIIMAEMDDYIVIEDIIKKLDIPRAMVYIEALIMEVNVEKDFRLGTELIAGGKTTYDNKKGLFGGGFSGGAIGGDPGFSSIPDASNLLPPGFSMGFFGEKLQIGDLIFPNLSGIIQAYRKDKDVQILSTPQILTTDNEEAKINVGKNIPFQTKTSTTDNETFNSFEYKDVGTTLKITPQISKDRMVRLNISLEVTSLESTTAFRPTTLKRTVDTTALVHDNHTVVIGGLIDDSVSLLNYKIPCLGDIPGLKWLFSSMSRSGGKTNLFVFITPHVIKNDAEAEQIRKGKKDAVDKVIEGKIKMYKSTDLFTK